MIPLDKQQLVLDLLNELVVRESDGKRVMVGKDIIAYSSIGDIFHALWNGLEVGGRSFVFRDIDIRDYHCKRIIKNKSEDCGGSLVTKQRDNPKTVYADEDLSDAYHFTRIKEVLQKAYDLDIPASDVYFNIIENTALPVGELSGVGVKGFWLKDGMSMTVSTVTKVKPNHWSMQYKLFMPNGDLLLAWSAFDPLLNHPSDVVFLDREGLFSYSNKMNERLYPFQKQTYHEAVERKGDYEFKNLQFVLKQ